MEKIDWTSIMAGVLLVSRLIKEVPAAIHTIREWLKSRKETGEDDEPK